ncbi:hypothetical protein EBU91_02550 [bacterium]|nr:hypothetical protein [bacterium]
MKNFLQSPILWYIISAMLLIYSIFAPNLLLKIGLSIASGIIIGHLLWEQEQKREKENRK